MISRKPIRVAVLGAGDWARQYHLPALKALEEEIPLKIAGIWNRTTALAELAARQFGLCHAYSSLDEAMNDKNLDCFVVLVNSTALLEIVSSLVVRHLPIFTEKPPGKSYEEALKLAEIVDTPNVVAFNRRYMPLNRRFKELADSIGSAYFAECRFYRNERTYDHFILETGVHGINYMEYLCGPIRTARTEKRMLPHNGTDLWISSVTFESGMRGIMKFFPCCGSSVERYEVHGQNTSIYLNCPQTYTSDHPGKIVVHEKGKMTSSVQDEESEPLLSAGFLDEYRDFFRAVREGSHTASNIRNACNTMRVAEAIEATESIVRETAFPPISP
ncbi:MAG: Gfo/Idh/MocA family oxidoreductase [Treponemataceae bacterium]